MFFADDLGIFFSHIAALGGHSVDVAVLFQLVIGPFRGDNADAQILGQGADGGKQLAFGQFTRQDGGFDLAVNLLVNGPVVCVADNDVQKITSQLFMNSIYSICTFVNSKKPGF